MTEARRQLPPPLSLPVPFRSAVHGTQIFADQRRFLFRLNGTQICTDGHRFFFSLSRITNNDCCASCLLVVSLSKDALYLLSLPSVLFSLARCGLPPASYSLAPCSSLFTTDDGPLTTDPCLPPTAKRFGLHLLRHTPWPFCALCPTLPRSASSSPLHGRGSHTPPPSDSPVVGEARSLSHRGPHRAFLLSIPGGNHP